MILNINKGMRLMEKRNIYGLREILKEYLEQKYSEQKKSGNIPERKKEIDVMGGITTELIEEALNNMGWNLKNKFGHSYMNKYQVFEIRQYFKRSGTGADIIHLSDQLSDMEYWSILEAINNPKKYLTKKLKESNELAGQCLQYLTEKCSEQDIINITEKIGDALLKNLTSELFKYKYKKTYLIPYSAPYFRDIEQQLFNLLIDGFPLQRMIDIFGEDFKNWKSSCS